MKLLKVRLRDAKKERPVASMRTFVITESGFIGDVAYSKKHDLFNANDGSPDSGFKENAVLFWVPMAELGEALEAATGVPSPFYLPCGGDDL